MSFCVLAHFRLSKEEGHGVRWQTKKGLSKKKGKESSLFFSVIRGIKARGKRRYGIWFSCKEKEVQNKSGEEVSSSRGTRGFLLF